jgi:hypothetical protein
MRTALLAGCAVVCLSLTGCPLIAAMTAVGAIATVVQAGEMEAERATRSAEAIVATACRRYATASSVALASAAADAARSARVKSLVEYGSAACENPPTDGDPVEFGAWLYGISQGLRGLS